MSQQGTGRPSPTIGRWSRRGVLGAAGVGALGAGAGVVAGRAGASADGGGAGELTYAFRGAHQAGVVTPVQEHLHFAAYDLVEGATREDLIALLQEWTAAAERLTRGQPVTEDGAVGGPLLAPPDDTGETLDLGAHGLTVTFGFGPSLFTGELGRRLGLTDRRPAALNRLPLFAFDLLEEPISDGDLCLQVCAEDPHVAVHAIRNLTRIAFGTAMIRWSQIGFGRTAATTRSQSTPRNLFGFKDGTANVMSDETEALERWVWVPDDAEPAWMAGGTYLVTRKIMMTIENWDRVSLDEQQKIMGRDKKEGAPLSGGGEFTEPDFTHVGADGEPLIPLDSHVRLSHPDANKGQRMLRRSYNFVDGNNPLGQLSAGLFFISFQRDPQQFIDIQNSLKADTLNEYIRHVGSALFAVPGGIRPGEWVGQFLFD
ncbi:deferrochelatase/peroxidase EfeB [Nocardioides sp. zg-536]|uniref:Deferrochelatase n=1 Tax=Nocardioides faecalis TaxID=2803858 RepID=A0A939BW86_9ACTN|nr:iron uptake transporter deferrochelatase/peroxidase subunit [Nocardioides faecalis]MBM9460766.1 deferrochelatase/peroxidase EfeB [Nocardioides faecalis]MBS4752705.1 deferrochelatase/peroxidase EfeB [Nocardioides faecalis]QVI57959.1 deferrochelatase/peroxidase EfeB [Nocardioides faecalis]